MAPISNESDAPLWLALLMVCIGGGIILLAAGIIPSDPAQFNAPRSVVAVAGFVFFIAGVSMFGSAQSAWRSFCMIFLLAAMAFLGLWVAFVADGTDISGGLPFLPQSVNGKLGKVIFGLGALVSLGIMIIAIKDTRRRMSSGLNVLGSTFDDDNKKQP